MLQGSQAVLSLQWVASTAGSVSLAGCMNRLGIYTQVLSAAGIDVHVGAGIQFDMAPAWLTIAGWSDPGGQRTFADWVSGGNPFSFASKVSDSLLQGVCS
jgi:hypothetical protein